MSIGTATPLKFYDRTFDILKNDLKFNVAAYRLIWRVPGVPMHIVPTQCTYRFIHVRSKMNICTATPLKFYDIRFDILKNDLKFNVAAYRLIWRVPGVPMHIVPTQCTYRFIHVRYKMSIGTATPLKFYDIRFDILKNDLKFNVAAYRLIWRVPGVPMHIVPTQCTYRFIHVRYKMSIGTATPLKFYDIRFDILRNDLKFNVAAYRLIWRVPGVPMHIVPTQCTYRFIHVRYKMNICTATPLKFYDMTFEKTI